MFIFNLYFTFFIFQLSQLKLQEIPNETLEELTVYQKEELVELDMKHMMTEMKVQEEKLKSIKPNFTAIKVRK